MTLRTNAERRGGLCRIVGGGGENLATMQSLSSHIEQLERVLLRRGLGVLEADRSCCADCGRTPLVGEQVHVYEGKQERIVCELCRPRRRETPQTSEIVRHFERGHTVRITARAA